MPSPNDSKWFVKYEEPRSQTKLLVSMPIEMARDVRLLASYKGITSAELVRRAVTEKIAAQIQAEPLSARSFKGRP